MAALAAEATPFRAVLIIHLPDDRGGRADPHAGPTVGYTGGSSTCTWPAATSGVADNSRPAWISITRNSGATPAGSIDESTLTSTRGDSGGQFRQVDSKYMYNSPVNDLQDKSATYTVGVSFNPDGSSPIANTVNFGLK